MKIYSPQFLPNLVFCIFLFHGGSTYETSSRLWLKPNAISPTITNARLYDTLALIRLANRSEVTNYFRTHYEIMTSVSNELRKPSSCSSLLHCWFPSLQLMSIHATVSLILIAAFSVRRPARKQQELKSRKQLDENRKRQQFSPYHFPNNALPSEPK